MEESDTGSTAQIRLVLAAVLVAFLAQTALNPIIAPLSREVGLAEWQVGVTISTAAVMVVITSQAWGRLSQSWGRAPVLITAFGVAAVALALFALVAWLGMAGVVTGATLFALFILLRGVLVGTAIAAVPPTAQAFIADVTPDEEARVRGMAGVGSAQGVAMVGGAVLGGLLALGGLMVPLIAIPLILLAGLVLLYRKLERQSATSLVAAPIRVRPTDPRIWPYLLAGFGMFTALGFIQIVSGFLVQDRLDVQGSQAGFIAGMALLAAGIGLVLAQGVLVPRARWSVATLLRVGAVVALFGFVLLVPDLGAIGLFGSHVIIGFGLGTAMPGYTAGATMRMTRAELGGAVGLVGATNGLTFVVAPTLSTALYGVSPTLPVVIGAVVIAAVAIFVVIHPRFRGLAAQAAVDGAIDPSLEDRLGTPPS